MKKSLLALAVLSSVSYGAYAQTTNVTIYGMIDIGAAYEHNGAGTAYRLDSGNLNGSRLGFKGTEDLGGGLKAMFQLENGFSTDTGALGQGGLLFGRHAWVGLSSADYGTVKLGRQILPVYDNADVFDPFADSLAGDTARIFNYSGIRVNNSGSYTFAAKGLKVEVMTGLGEVPNNNAASRTVAGYALYTQGPAQALVTYTKINSPTGNDSNKTTLLGGNWNFGPVKVFGAYAWNKGLAALNTRDALIGVSAPVMSTDLVMASYQHKTDKTVNSANAGLLAFGYIHNMSKRTAIYTSLGFTKNDRFAAYNNALTNGASDSLFMVGIRHIF